MVSVGQGACDQMKFSLAEELGRGPQFAIICYGDSCINSCIWFCKSFKVMCEICKVKTLALLGLCQF